MERLILIDTSWQIGCAWYSSQVVRIGSPHSHTTITFDKSKINDVPLNGPRSNAIQKRYRANRRFALTSRSRTNTHTRTLARLIWANVNGILNLVFSSLWLFFCISSSKMRTWLFTWWDPYLVHHNNNSNNNKKAKMKKVYVSTVSGMVIISISDCTTHTD